MDGFGVVGLIEHTRARHDGVGAGFDHLPGIACLDAAVDFNPGIQATLVAHAAQVADFVDLVLNEALTAETRVDAHHQHQITELKAVLEGVDWGARVQHSASFFAEIFDLSQVAVQVGAGFDLNADDVGAGLGEVFDVLLRLNNH